RLSQRPSPGGCAATLSQGERASRDRPEGTAQDARHFAIGRTRGRTRLMVDGNDKPGRDCCAGLSRRGFVRAVGAAARATAAPGVAVAAEKAGPTPEAAAETAVGGVYDGLCQV